MRIEPEIEQIREWLKQPRDIVILSHRNPDGDALGSCLAMRSFLEQMGQSVKVCLPSEYPVNFEWMAGAKDILIYDINPEECKQVIERSNLVICCDFNSLDRIDKIGELIQLHSDAPVFLIDHHMDPEPFADEVFSDPLASSTCELVVELIGMMGEEDRMNRDVAEACYTGLITDTGRFKYALSPKVFEVAAKLLRAGVRDKMIVDKIFNCNTEKQLRLLGFALYERLEVLEDYDTAIISLTKEDYKRFSISRGDTEGIVNYMLTMPHIQLAAFITEQPTITKYSLRSKGDLSVQEMAREHFNGGGHKNASGGAVRKPLQKAIDDFKKVLPKYTKRSIL